MPWVRIPPSPPMGVGCRPYEHILREETKEVARIVLNCPTQGLRLRKPACARQEWQYETHSNRFGDSGRNVAFNGALFCGKVLGYYELLMVGKETK